MSENMKTENERDNLIYTVVVRCYEQEQALANRLDSKAYNIIGITAVFSAFIITVLTFLLQTLYTSLLLIPFIPLTVTAVLGVLAYQIKTYTVINPQKFIDEYKNQSYETTLKNYAVTLANTTNINCVTLNRKADLIMYALWFLLSAATLFFASIIVSLLI